MGRNLCLVTSDLVLVTQRNPGDGVYFLRKIVSYKLKTWFAGALCRRREFLSVVRDKFFAWLKLHF